MKNSHVFRRHRLFFVLLGLFILVGALDMLNVDQLVYTSLCNAVAPVSGTPCSTYYDVPIWNVYLSLAILAVLYSVHGEIRISNRHLSSKK